MSQLEHESNAQSRIKEYFNKDTFHCDATSRRSLTITTNNTTYKIISSLYFHLPSNTKFIGFYISRLNNIAEIYRFIIKNLTEILRIADIGMQFSDNGERYGSFDSKNLVFSRRIIIYCEDQLNDLEIETLVSDARKNDISLVYRGPKYSRERDIMEKPADFISHDSGDKDAIARPLATKLQDLKIPVWYDEFSLRVGDSLRKSIETGLKECHKCILVLSPNFLANEGWTKAEFDSIFTREILEKSNVILPIWAGVKAKDVYDYSPRLADRLGVDWGKGIDHVCRELLKVLPN